MSWTHFWSINPIFISRKFIYFLVVLVIILAIILLIKIKTTSEYDPKIYADIYDEYEKIFGQEDDFQKNDESIAQNIIDNHDIKNENNTYITAVGATTNNTENSKVIGEIIIPKIEIKYPIIKETTTEYLKVAPTKYCGPEVNEIRKFSYSRA